GEGHQLGHGNGEPERPDAQRVDAQHAEDRRYGQRRRIARPRRLADGQRPRGRPRRERPAAVCGLQSDGELMRRALPGVVALTLATGWLSQAQQDRRAPPPTPRLADGTVNLGRVPGEKGVWRVPY